MTRWTTERPTTAGWFWWRCLDEHDEDGHHREEICHVFRCTQTLDLRVNWTTDCYANGSKLSEYDRGEWQPVKEPEA